jgi:hypothetical protein
MNLGGELEGVCGHVAVRQWSGLRFVLERGAFVLVKAPSVADE